MLTSYCVKTCSWTSYSLTDNFALGLVHNLFRELLSLIAQMDGSKLFLENISKFHDVSGYQQVLGTTTPETTLGQVEWRLWRSDILYNSRDLQLAGWSCLLILLLWHCGFLLTAVSLLAPVTDHVTELKVGVVSFGSHFRGFSSLHWGKHAVWSGSTHASWSLQETLTSRWLRKQSANPDSEMDGTFKALPLVTFICTRFHSQSFHMSQNSSSSWWSRWPCTWAGGGHLRLKSQC